MCFSQTPELYFLRVGLKRGIKKKRKRREAAQVLVALPSIKEDLIRLQL